MELNLTFLDLLMIMNYQLRMRTYKALLLILTTLLLQEPVSSVNAEELLEPMQVKALRLGIPLRALPARIEVIDRERILQSGRGNLVDVLRKEANLQVRSTSGNSARSEVSIGGFGENASQRTLVLLDGHRINANDLSQVNWYSIPLYLVDSIEVIRGGQSAAYGNHAVGGVIKINTIRPSIEPAGSVEVSGGSFDSFQGRAALSQWVGGVGFTLHGERSESNGFRQNGDHETTAGGLRLDWGKGDTWKAYLSWNLANSEFGLPGDLNASEIVLNRRQSNEPSNRGEEKASHGRSGFSMELAEDWAIEGRVGYLDRDVKATMPSMSFLSDTVYETFSLSPCILHESEHSSSSFGLDYYRDRLVAVTNYADSSLRRRTLGAFASTSRSLSADWLWNSSMRIESAKTSGNYDGTVLNEIEAEEWAGSLGLVRQLGDGNRAYGALRRFYRYPATDEILVFFPGYSLNPLLLPESGFEVELGVDWNWENLVFGGRLFRQWMKDEIIYDSASFANLNLDATNRLGLDFTLQWQVSDAIESGLRYEYVRAELDGGSYDGSKVPLVPESLLRLYANFDLSDDLRMNWGSSYVGKSFAGGDFANSSFKVEDYWLHDLSLDYQFGDRTTIFGGIENLFDEDFLSTAFGSGLYPGAGRSGKVGLRYSF